MANPTRYPSGISTQFSYQTLGNAGFPDPAKYQVWFNDFNTLTASDYTVTTVGTGTTALTSQLGGAVVSTTSAGGTDAEYLQVTPASFGFTPTTSSVNGLRAFFRANFKVSDATNSAIHAGLIVQSTTPQAPTDGLYFLKASGATTFILRSMNGSVATDLAITGFNFANNTTIELGFYFDGKTTVYAFVNDETTKGAVASFQPSLTTALLCPSWGILNGAAASKTMTVDHIIAAVER